MKRGALVFFAYARKAPQLKMLVMASVTEMKFLSSPDETMEMANLLYDWIMEEGKIKEFRVVLKCDVKGTIEALTSSLAQLSTDEVKIRILHSGVGGISLTHARASRRPLRPEEDVAAARPVRPPAPLPRSLRHP